MVPEDGEKLICRPARAESGLPLREFGECAKWTMVLLLMYYNHVVMQLNGHIAVMAKAMRPMSNIAISTTSAGPYTATAVATPAIVTTTTAINSILMTALATVNRSSYVFKTLCWCSPRAGLSFPVF